MGSCLGKQDSKQYFGGVICKNMVFDIFFVIGNVRYWRRWHLGKKMDAYSGLWGHI